MISYLLLLFVILILSINSLINKSLAVKFSPFTIQYIQSLFSIIMFPVWFFLSRKYELANQIIDKISVSYVFISSILSTLGFLCLLHLIKDKPVFIITSLLSTYPVVTMIICLLSGAARPTSSQIVGVLLILVGIILVQIRMN